MRVLFTSIIMVASLFALTVFADIADVADDSVKATLKKASHHIRVLARVLNQEDGDERQTVVIGVMQDALSDLFPEDATQRQKVEIRAILSDGVALYRSKLAAGGQSSLKSATPNLRIEKVNGVNGEEATELAGTPIIRERIRLNPLTMDDGYAATLSYLELLNQLEISPTQTDSEYTKVVYVGVKPDGTLDHSSMVTAGLHLATFNPVHYLRSIEHPEGQIVAVARSRYNIQNRVDQVLGLLPNDMEQNIRARIGQEMNPDDYFRSIDVRFRRVGNFRIEHKWQDEDLNGREHLESAIAMVYEFRNAYRGRQLYDALNRKMNLEQFFTFVAINDITKNGDISDEFFWYLVREPDGRHRLHVLPQDGDDMFQGAHSFIMQRGQAGLWLRERTNRDTGFIYNLEGSLFRTIKNDPYMYAKYLENYKRVAAQLQSRRAGEPSKSFDVIVREKLAPYANDAEVLQRGATDSRQAAYPEGQRFIDVARGLHGKIFDNITTAPRRINLTGCLDILAK